MRITGKRMAMMFAFAWLATFPFIALAPRVEAASAEQINDSVHSTLDALFDQVRGSRELVAKSAGVLVFPTVIKAGIGFGGEYGEGALLKRGRTIEYYNTVSASVGFQLGAQARSVVIVFVTPEALNSFRRVDGWKVGVRRVGCPHYRRRWGFDRYIQGHQPHRWLHIRWERPDV